MKKKYAIPYVLLLSSLAVVPMIHNSGIKVCAEAQDDIFSALAISANDINEQSLLIDPLSPAADASNTAGKGCQFKFTNQLTVTGTDGFAFRVKNLANQILQTRLCINTGDQGYTLTNSTVDLYDLEGNHTSATCGFRFVTIPANFDGVAVIRWNTMVPYRWDGSDDWSIAVAANKLVKGSEGQTAYPSGKANLVAFYVEKNVANDHTVVNPFVVGNFYTFTESEDNKFEAVKYENPLSITFNDNLGSCFYPRTATTLIDACNASAANINAKAICLDPLDPVATTGDKGGIINIIGNHYLGNSDGIAFRVKNTAANTIKTKLYVEIKSGIDGKQSGYCITGGTTYFYNLDGTSTSYAAGSSDRTMVIPAYFDGVVYIPWSSFVPYKYQGTTDWTNYAKVANKLVKGSTGMTAYPEGRMASMSLYIQKDAAHTTANINPFIMNNIYGVTENEGSFTVINHEGGFKNTVGDSDNVKGNIDIYAYPTAKQTYEFRINGVKTLESDVAKFNLQANDVEVAYGEKLTFNPEALGDATLAGVTLDDTPINNYSFVNYEKEAGNHVINLTTATTTLYEVSATFNASQASFELEGKVYSAPLNLEENEKVNLKVVAKEGYRISKVLVDGNEVTLDAEGCYEFDLIKATSIEVKTCLDYQEFENYASINSQFDNNAIVMDPTLTTGASNAGGNIFSNKKIELEGTTAIAFRVKNLENTDYVINTVYVQCSDNYSYSIYDATTKFVSLDGTETTTSMTGRQVKIPANFDGYMVIDYSQLVTIKTGGSWDWSKRAADHLTSENYPTKNFDFVSIYFPVNSDMAKVNEMVLGTDVYTIAGNSIKKYANALTITGNTLVDSVIDKNYPAGTTTLTCENANVVVNKESFKYAETITVSPKEGYTIESAKLGDDNLTANEDGTYSIRVGKEYGESATLNVVATQKVYYKVEATYNNNQVILNVNDNEYNSNTSHKENSKVTLEVEAKENYVIDAVKVNGEVVTLTEGKYEFEIDANATVEVLSHLYFDAYEAFEEINSKFDNTTMVFDPSSTTGTNEGGNIFASKAVELEGTDAIVLRIKNAEDNQFDINCIYIQCADNYSYSTMGSEVRFISLDGSELLFTNTADNRKVMVPANFDGYMFLEYSQLVVIRTPSGWDWSKKSANHLSEAEYPTKNLSFISLYTSNGTFNAGINELYLGSDVYTIAGNQIKGYKNTLSLTNTSIVDSLAHKYLPVFNSTITCNNENVTVNKTSFAYGDTLVVSPKEGYTIVSVKVGEEEFTSNDDGTFTLRISKAYDEEVTLNVEASQKIYYRVNAIYNSSEVLVNLNDNEYNASAKYEEATKVTLEVEAKENYVIDAIKVNGETITLTEGRYEFEIDADATVEVVSHLRYESYDSFANINSPIDGKAMVFDPNTLSGATNEGGHILLTNHVDLAGSDAVALRIRNIEDYDYIINTLYLQCEDNFSYSLWDATIKFVDLEGNETTTTMSSRQIKIPANFDGYMVIGYNQLVEIRTGGNYFWDKKTAEDKLSTDKYPTKKLSFVSFYWPIAASNEGANELVIGSDVYTLFGNEIRGYNELSLDQTTVVETVTKKYFPVFTKNVTCNNDNVTVNVASVGYGDKIEVLAKEGYTILSVKIGEVELTKGNDNTYSYKVREELDSDVELLVETASCHNVVVTVDEKTSVSLESTSMIVIGDNKKVEFTVTVADGYEVDYVKANGELVEANEGKYSIEVTSDVNIEVKARIINFIITYNLDGGTNNANNRETFTIEDQFTLLEATKEGYEFLGWYKLVGDTKEEVTRIFAGTKEDLVLYAEFEKIEEEDPDTSSSGQQESPSETESPSESPSVQPSESSSSQPQEEPAKPAKKKGCKNASIPSALGFLSILGALFFSKKNKK